MSSLVSKEKSEELGQWAHNAYLEALAETEKTAQKLNQHAHERAVASVERETPSWTSLVVGMSLSMCLLVNAIWFWCFR